MLVTILWHVHQHIKKFNNVFKRKKVGLCGDPKRIWCKTMPLGFSLMLSFKRSTQHNKKGEIFSFHMHNGDQSKNQWNNGEIWNKFTKIMYPTSNLKTYHNRKSIQLLCEISIKCENFGTMTLTKVFFLWRFLKKSTIIIFRLCLLCLSACMLLQVTK
jgi:hypothetical protein